MAVLGQSYFSTNSIYKYLQEIKFNIVDGPCFEEGVEKDASTTHQKNSPVCISAKRFSRFPKSALKNAFIPVVFHEVAHQFGFGEAGARILQALAELHIKYRPIFLASKRTKADCGLSSRSLNDSQKKELQEFLISSMKIDATLSLSSREISPQLLIQCSAEATRAAVALKQAFDGDPQVNPKQLGLSEKELADFSKYLNQYDPVGFENVILALSEPSITGYYSQDLKNLGVDPQYMMMLGGKAALKIIDDEVGRMQDKITPESVMN